MRFARLYIIHILVIVLFAVFSGERVNELVCILHGFMHETHVAHEHHMGHEHCHHHTHTPVAPGTVALDARDHNCCLPLEVNEAIIPAESGSYTMDEGNFCFCDVETFQPETFFQVVPFLSQDPGDYAHVRWRSLPGGFDICILICSFLN